MDRDGLVIGMGENHRSIDELAQTRKKNWDTLLAIAAAETDRKFTKLRTAVVSAMNYAPSIARDTNRKRVAMQKETNTTKVRVLNSHRHWSIWCQCTRVDPFTSVLERYRGSLGLAPPGRGRGPLAHMYRLSSSLVLVTT